MEYLHSMIRVTDLEANLKFFCDVLEFTEIDRIENKRGRFTLIFLAAKGDSLKAKEEKTPLLELTYNWPEEGKEDEKLGSGRNFGHLAYRVENIYELCDRIASAGVTINRPPRDGYMAFLKSPEGISIELLQKGSALAPEEPWQSMENQGSW